MPGPIWKGSQGPVLSREETVFDAESQTYSRITTWQGSQDAIAGLEPGIQEQELSYDTFNDGPVYELRTAIPLIAPDTQPVDQYEIFSESTQISIYTHSDIFAEAQRWDITLRGAARTYRRQAEDLVDDGTAIDADLNNTVLFPEFPNLVKHLRGGVDSFDVDFLVLRRFRRIDRTYARGATGKLNLNFSQIIYSTARLNLPADVAFIIPNPPTEQSEFSDQFAWGWRMRSQNSEFVGQWVEQRYELIFAPHSLMRNSVATTNLVW